MNTNLWNRSREALGLFCLLGSSLAAAGTASADGVPDYIGFVSHNSALPNPDRPYEMVSFSVHDVTLYWYSLYDLVFEPLNPAQLDVPNRNEDGNYVFDSQYDISFRAIKSTGLGPPQSITGTGRAHAVGTAPGGDWPFTPLVFDTELIAFDLFRGSPTPESDLIRESPTLRSTGVTVVEDLCPLCLGPLPTLRISSFFDISMEVDLPGELGWSPFNNAVRVAQYPAPTTPGDYNSNGVVDAADYNVWRNNVGGAFSLPNDNTFGVTNNDYEYWRNNYGTIAAAGLAPSAVPEPAALALVVILVGWSALARGLRQLAA